MNRKQFIVLLALACVIGGAWLWVRQRNSDSWQGGGKAIGQKLLPRLAVNDIAQIAIRAGTNELNLARRENLWRVRERSDYPADFSRLSDLLLKLADLKVVQTEEIGPSQLARFELTSPGPGTNTGTLLELKDANGKTVSALLLGKRHLHQAGEESPYGGAGRPDGRYVQAGGGHDVAVISDTLDSVQCQPQPWLDKEFFRIEKPRRIAVKFPAAANSWELTRASETNDWLLADAQPGEKLDSSKISSVTSPFSSPSFNDVARGDSVGTNATMVTIDTFDGFTYVIQVGAGADGNHPLKLSVSGDFASERVPGKDEKPEDKTKLDQEFKERRTKLNDKLAAEKQFADWTYTVPNYVCDSVLKPRSELLAGVPQAPPSATPAPVPAAAPAHPSAAAPAPQPLTSDIVRVPSADALQRGEKVEVIKPEDAARMAREGPAKEAAATNNSSNGTSKP
jgi:hypothetical protein